MEIEAEIKRQNEVINTRMETRSVEIGRDRTPIFATRRERRTDLVSQLISVRGSGYTYYQEEVGATITVHWREEQREIKTLRCGLEQYGDWQITKTWSSTL